MNRSESKYFNTAKKMDEAFLTLLEKKDLAYITVKEIYAAAGVNRSTFYLHYETLGDLLAEMVTGINEQFLAHMKKDAAAFIERLRTCPREELYLVTPEYLVPYLGFIEQNQRLFLTVLDNAATLRLDQSYEAMFANVISPILDRYGVTEKDRPYLMAFYLQGLMTIVSVWLKGGCAEPVDYVVKMIQRCVKRSEEGR
ncbi:MAG: TetR-like C-terminal domain-containing protein [Coriobacteriia bacterium]|nr:TetR-like C-terminal domain-containing protein [Coriobacteriia bacterium]